MQKVSLETIREFGAERFTKKIVFTTEKNTVFVLGFMPGQALPPHNHPDADLFMLVLEGEGILSVNETQTAITTGDALNIAGDERISFHNTGNAPARLYVMLSKR